MKVLKYLLISLIIFSGCKEKVNEPEQVNNSSHTISGNLLYKGIPLAKATISMDDQLNYTVESNDNGYFEIKNVIKGLHSLKISKSFNDGTFLEKNAQIDVSNDVFLDALRLPKAAYLYNPENATSNSTNIAWSPTDASDFREYKVFRNNSAGIDENNGKLVYVSTSINDTSFQDTNLDPLTNYYYRVYVMNEFGRLGGSNIISIKTENQNLIANGDFEEIGTDSLATYWDFRNEVFKPIRSQEAQSGNYYLLGDAKRYVSDLSWGSLQYRVTYTKLIPGKEYILSFYYYIEELPGNSYFMVEFNPEQQTFIWEHIQGPSTGKWQKIERTFTAPSNITSDFYLRFEVNVNAPYNNEPWKVRLDNVSLMMKE